MLVINIIICFVGKRIRVSYVKSLSFLISDLLIIPVISPLFPLRSAGEAATNRARFFVQFKAIADQMLSNQGNACM